MPLRIIEAAIYVQRQIAVINRLDTSKPADMAELKRISQRVHAVEQDAGLCWGTYNPDLED